MRRRLSRFSRRATAGPGASTSSRYNPHNGFTSTKNDKIRELPLTWDAIAALEAQRKLVDVDNDLVFPGADGEVLWRVQWLWIRRMPVAAEISARTALVRLTEGIPRMTA